MSWGRRCGSSGLTPAPPPAIKIRGFAAEGKVQDDQWNDEIAATQLSNLAHLFTNIHVDRQVLFIQQGKGQKDRYVPIGKRALNWIARYVEHARDRLAIDPKQAILFLTIDGSPLNPDSLTEYGRRYIKAAGIDKPGACHIFRHTMATLMHDNGADIRTIQAILGHEKLDTTQIYTRVGLKSCSTLTVKPIPPSVPTPSPKPNPKNLRKNRRFGWNFTTSGHANSLQCKAWSPS